MFDLCMGMYIKYIKKWDIITYELISWCTSGGFSLWRYANPELVPCSMDNRWFQVRGSWAYNVLHNIIAMPKYSHYLQCSKFVKVSVQASPLHQRIDKTGWSHTVTHQGHYVRMLVLTEVPNFCFQLTFWGCSKARKTTLRKKIFSMFTYSPKNSCWYTVPLLILLQQHHTYAGFPSKLHQIHPCQWDEHLRNCQLTAVVLHVNTLTRILKQ